MNRIELDNWWCGLTRYQKERIATKAATKSSGNDTRVEYPECTVWWNSVDYQRKQAIHDHCTDKHGYLLDEWSEGKSYSY
ncbi:MAG: hypothetical protein ACI308_01800 [Muribaculaceae bacterium]